MDFDFDDETSSDDETSRDFKYDSECKIIRRIHECEYKCGREYINLSTSKYSILVPSFEFEKKYEKDLNILRNKCKNINITENSNGIKSYTFMFNCHNLYCGKIFIPKYKYIYDDIELHIIAQKFENIVDVYSEWMYSEEIDKSWFVESKNGKLNQEGIEKNCSVKEYFNFFDESVIDNPDAYISKYL